MKCQEYLKTEIDQIVSDYKSQPTDNKTLDEFATLWVERHGEEFAIEHRENNGG